MKRTIAANHIDSAVDPLGRRSSNYSGRSILTVCGEIIGWNNVLALVNYSSRFKELMGFLSVTNSDRSMERY